MPESLYRYIVGLNPRGQVLLVILTAMVFPLSMAPLELQRRIINEAVEGQDFRLLLWLGAAYLGVMLLHGGLKYLMNIQRGRIIQQAKSHLREAVYHCIYAVVPPKRWREENGEKVDQGTVVSMLSSEAEKLGQFVGAAFSTPLLQGGTMVAVLGYMIWVEPVVALIGFAVYSPQMIIIPLMQQRINRHNRDYAEQVRELGDFVVENAEDEACQEAVPEPYKEINDRMVVAKMKAIRLKYLMKFIRNFLNHLGPLSILLVGGWQVIQGETEVGTIVAFLSGFERISNPWRELIAFYRQVSNARMKYRLLVESFPIPPGEAETPEPRHV